MNVRCTASHGSRLTPQAWVLCLCLVPTQNGQLGSGKQQRSAAVKPLRVQSYQPATASSSALAPAKSSASAPLKASFVTCGYYHTVVVTTDCKLVAFGANDYGTNPPFPSPRLFCISHMSCMHALERQGTAPSACP